ncbi:hypothetical protein ACFPPD_17380 [Cohnella suwonensis]|uniref:YolD-like protein n=1 Tax=Cohnella suwonensis TaxID=696072 RepID=A0ABW0LXG0_9BACL
MTAVEPTNARPAIGSAEWQDILRVLLESLGMQTSAKFRLYDPLEDCAVIGVVERVDPYDRTFTVDGERFNLADITEASAEYTV